MSTHTERDPDRARSALKDLKRLGVSIALDNFGSGEFSLRLPRDLPLDVLKVDRALVQSFDRDKERRAVFAATIALWWGVIAYWHIQQFLLPAPKAIVQATAASATSTGNGPPSIRLPIVRRAP